MAKTDHYYFDNLDIAKGVKQGVEIIAEELIDYHLSVSATRPKLHVNGKYEVKVTFQEEP